jgi:2-hydroxy-6-oxonona-2,4-dienedioate hydrolase
VVVDRLAVHVLGSGGEPVLLMPGPHRFQRPGLRSADALITGLVGLGRTVVTFDPPGSGWSTRPARFGMPEMLSCTLEALAAAGVDEPVDAVGHSMGGLALLAFTLQHRDLVDRLVLIGTGRGGGTYLTAPGALWNWHHRAFPAVALLGSVHLAVGRLGSERLVNNLIERHSFVDQTHSRPARVRASDWLRPGAGRADWHRIARTLDYGPRLPEVTARTLVLCGRYDPQFPLACSIELGSGIPHAQPVVFDHSGHYPFIEEADAFLGQRRGVPRTRRQGGRGHGHRHRLSPRLIIQERPSTRFVGAAGQLRHVPAA